MSKTREQRVDDALTQLVDRTLPSPQAEDDVAADERYYQALERARDVIDRCELLPLLSLSLGLMNS